MDVDAFTHVACCKHTATARIEAVDAFRTVAVEVNDHPAGTVIAVVIETAFGIATFAAAFNLNTAVDSFPSNIIAKKFGFEKKDFFDIDEAEKQNVKVSF